MNNQHTIIGKQVRVTDAIGAGTNNLGTVMIPVRGGTEEFYAISSDGNPIPVGTGVVVLEYRPPRTVVVAADLF